MEGVAMTLAAILLFFLVAAAANWAASRWGPLATA